MPRKYEHVKELSPKIKEMVETGMTHREIEKKLGLSGENVVKRLIERERRKQREQSWIPKARGRKPAVTLQEYKYENKRLKMENELLRDFLESTERK